MHSVPKINYFNSAVGESLRKLGRVLGNAMKQKSAEVVKYLLVNGEVGNKLIPFNGIERNSNKLCEIEEEMQRPQSMSISLSSMLITSTSLG